MELKQLQAMGAIASRTLVQKDIQIKYQKPLPQGEWADPAVPEYPDKPEMVEETLRVFVRKRSAIDSAEFMRATDRERGFLAILRCVCNKDGSQLFDDLDQVASLADWMWIPLAAAVYEVNEFGPKNSQPRTSSGASSRSPSAAGRSRNGKRRSPRKSSLPGTHTAPGSAP